MTYYTHKSELVRLIGIKLPHMWGLINCPKCYAILDIRNGQLTRKCNKCGARFWLARTFNQIIPFYSHDDYELVRTIRAGIYGWWGCRGNSKIPHVFIPHRKIRVWKINYHAQLAERERQSREKDLGRVPGEPTAASREFVGTLQG